MNTDHKKYQSLSEVEAMDMHRQVEAREQELTDKGMKAGFDAGMDAAISRIVSANSGSENCRVTGCNNYDTAGPRNCNEDLTIFCDSFKPEVPEEVVT